MIISIHKILIDFILRFVIYMILSLLFINIMVPDNTIHIVVSSKLHKIDKNTEFLVHIYPSIFGILKTIIPTTPIPPPII